MAIETKILIQRHDTLGTILMESATNFMITQHLLIDKSLNSFTREWFIEKQRQESASTEFIKWKDNFPNIALYN
jgi:hypothetical protein